MRFARRLLLLAIMAITALAMTASSASAVEISEEVGTTTTHCSPVSLNNGTPQGGCAVEAVSEDHVELRSSLGVDFQCDNHFRARVGEDGEGYIYNQILTSGGEEDDCGLVACNAAPWAFQISGTAPDYKMEAQFCVTAFGFIDVTCHLPNIDVDPVGHTSVEFTTAPGTVGGPDPADHAPCEDGEAGVQGHWDAVANPPAGLPELEISG